MGLYKRKDSRFYWMTFRVNGRKLSESTQTANKKLAEKIYFKRITEITECRWFPGEAKKRTFEELEQRYMMEHSTVHKSLTSQARDVYSFKQLKSFFGGLTLSEIMPARISDYKSLRRRGGVKTATIAKELELLRNAFNLAVREWQWMEKNPFATVKIEKANNKIERWLTPEEEVKLLDASTPGLKDIIVFALSTGMRRGEILSLKWPQVNLLRRTVTLLETKNKEKRTAPLNQRALGILKANKRVVHISGYVFPSQAGTRIIPSNLLRCFYRARKEAGLDDVRFHDLRHTFATRLVQSRVDLYVVKELMGHKDVKMTMRYAHHYPESLRHGVDALDNGDYVLATFDKKTGNGSASSSLQHVGKKKKNMVGDTGFEPVTSAV